MSPPRTYTRTRADLLLLLAAAAFGAAVAPPSARADEAENLRRLETIPPEQRRALAESLDRFGRLGSREQQAIRALDRELAAKPADERARLHAVLRRYHLWLEGLPKEERDEIRNAPPGERFALIRRAQEKDKERASTGRRKAPEFLQVVDVGDLSPIDVAAWLKVWLVLTPEEREEFEKIPPFSHERRQAFLDSLDPPRTIEPVSVQLTPEQERELVDRMRKKREYRDWLPSVSRAWELTPPEGRWGRGGEPRAESPTSEGGGGRGTEPGSEPAPPEGRGGRENEPRPDAPRDRGGPPTKGAGRGSAMRFWRDILIHCQAGHYYFIENPPEPVDPGHLFRFQMMLPVRIRDSITYLPPEEARRRLTILYRLIYPYPGDMPLHPAPAPAPDAAGRTGVRKAPAVPPQAAPQVPF